MCRPRPSSADMWIRSSPATVMFWSIAPGSPSPTLRASTRSFAWPRRCATRNADWSSRMSDRSCGEPSRCCRSPTSWSSTRHRPFGRQKLRALYLLTIANHADEAAARHDLDLAGAEAVLHRIGLASALVDDFDAIAPAELLGRLGDGEQVAMLDPVVVPRLRERERQDREVHQVLVVDSGEGLGEHSAQAEVPGDDGRVLPAGTLPVVVTPDDEVVLGLTGALRVRLVDDIEGVVGHRRD